MSQARRGDRVANARSIARDLRAIVSQPDEVASRLRLVGRKLPAIVSGLKEVGKSDKSEVLSIGTYLEKNARERPDATAVFYEDRRFSHRELDEQANRWASVFKARGLRKGDAVAVLLENRPEILFAVAGAVKIGAIAAVINTKQRKHVLQHSFGLCDPKVYVIGEELYDAFREIRGELARATPERVLFVPDDGASKVPADVDDAAAAVSKASTERPPELDSVTLGDPCFYIYTSGTTGLPKASIMSHFRWTKASAAFGKLALDLDASDIMFCSLPFYHNNALTVTWGSVAGAGAAMVIRRKFSASRFWDEVREYNATSFCYIGELCRYLMNQPPRPDDRDNPIKKIIGNGLRPDIWKAFKQRFGIDEVYEFYAASEGNAAFVNVFNLDATVGFCPAPYAIVEYDVDEDQPVRGPDGHLRRVPRGGIGLLITQVTEKYSFDGYTDRAASEKKLLRDVFEHGDLWFNTGDLLRDQGFRHAQFVDRVGDTFRWKGENVSTNEVAEVLNVHPQIDESTVYGVQIPGTDGRAGMAALVTNVPVEQVDLDSLARHVTGELPAYAVPLFLRLQPELEITGTFKQKKSTLRDEGFDPARVDEPLYVMLPGTRQYRRVTPEVFADIQAGKHAF